MCRFSRTDSATIINGSNRSDAKGAITQLPAKSEFVVFKKINTDIQKENIWEFMHPLWSCCDIVNHTEVSVGKDTGYILTCKKRD